MEPTAMLQAWRLRDRCLRVASYYRVMRLGDRAGERTHREAITARFQRWASSWLEQKRVQAAAAAEQGQRQGEEAEARQRRGELPSAATRMERKRPAVYRCGVRPYKKRTAQHVIDRRRLAKRGRRVDIVAGAEIGHRLYGDMMIIEERCRQERERNRKRRLIIHPGM